LPRLSDGTDKEARVYPVPIRVKVSGLFRAFVLIVIDFDTATAVVGVMVSEIVQLELAASVLPQVVLEIAKGEGAVKVGRLISVSSLFDRVTVCTALVAPTATLPKLTELGETADGETPVPVRFTVSGLLVPDVASVMELG